MSQSTPKLSERALLRLRRSARAAGRAYYPLFVEYIALRETAELTAEQQLRRQAIEAELREVLHGPARTPDLSRIRPLRAEIRRPAPAPASVAQLAVRDMLAATVAGRPFSIVPYARHLPLLEDARDLALAQALHREDEVSGSAAGLPFDASAFIARDRPRGAFVDPDADEFAEPDVLDDVARRELEHLPAAAYDEAMRIHRSGGGDDTPVYVTRRERDARSGWQLHGRDRLDVEPSELVNRLAPTAAERVVDLPDRLLSRARARTAVHAVDALHASRLLHVRLSDACATAELIGDPDDWPTWVSPQHAAVVTDAQDDRRTDAWLDRLGMPRAVIAADVVSVRSRPFSPDPRMRVTVSRLPVAERAQAAQARRAAMVAALSPARPFAGALHEAA